MARNVALYFALRTASLLVPAVPLRLAYGLASVLAMLAYHALSAPREGISLNLAGVLGLDPDDDKVRRAARAAFQNDAKNWVDTLRIGRLSHETILSLVEVEGWDRLRDGLAAGRGLIIVAMHLGDFDLVGQVVVARGLRLTVPVERMKPERLFLWLKRERGSKGINLVPLDQAPRELLRALRTGEPVAIMGDRVLAGKGVPARLFGRACIIPRSPMVLARRTGAPVVVAYGVRLASNRYHGFVSQPLPLESTGDQEQDDRRNAQILADEMAKGIARFPEQWLVFSPVWASEGPKNEPATIKRRAESRP